MKKIIQILCVLFLALGGNLSVAEAAVLVSKPSPTAVTESTNFSKISTEILSKQLGRKLTWREKIAFKIINWKLRRQLKYLSAADTTPVVKNNVSCDKIILKNGDEIDAKILGTNSEFVTFNNCGELNPLLSSSIYQSEVFMLKYADGRKEVIGNTNQNKTDGTSRKMEEPNASNALLALLAGFILLPAIFFTSIAAIYLGNKSLNNYADNPNKYTPESRSKARAAVTGGWIILALSVMLLLIFLALKSIFSSPLVLLFILFA